MLSLRKILNSFLVLSLPVSLLFPAQVFAEDPPIFERLSQDTLKVRGYGFHGFNFQNSSFVGTFPSTCFDTSLGDVYWYVSYTLTDSSNPSADLQLETPHTPGHYPTSFDYNVTFPGTYHIIKNQRLIQRCSNGDSPTAYMNSAYDLNLNVTIARDTGELLVDKGNTLDIYATGANPDRVSPEDYKWDLDNNGTFETQGHEIVFSAIGLTAGDYPLTVQVNDQWDTAEETFPVTVLEYIVNLSNPESIALPGIVTEYSGFTNPQDSLVEDNTGAIQDGNLEYFKLQYDLAPPIFTTYHISRGEIILKAKNTGVDAGKMGVQIFGDRKSSQISECAEIVPSTDFVEYRCTVNLHDWEDKTQKWVGILLEFSSEEGRDELLEIDSVTLNYKIKEAYLNIPFNAGGPYTVVKGEGLTVTAETPEPVGGNLYVNWDIDRDGYFDHGTNSLSYTTGTSGLESGEYSIGAKLFSRGGGSRVAMTNLTVVDATVDAGGPYTVTQGQTIQVNATSTDQNSASYIYTWDLDNNGDFETEGQNVTFSAGSLTPGEYSIAIKVTTSGGASVIDSTTVDVEANAQRQLSSLDPAQVWLGKGLLNIGVKFDLLAEAYVGSTLVSSGQVNSVTGGPVTFNNATLQTIPFDSFNPVDFPEGEELKVKLSVRNACSGSLLNFGTARLWYNDASANSRFGATVGESTSDYFLRDNFALSTSVGTGPRQNIAVQAGARCSAFKSLGTWTITP